jgi:hypothetical protein
MADERAIILQLNSMTKLRTIVLEYDLIEIHHNKNLKNKPYLVRVFSYNNSDPHEIRLNETELKDLYKILKNYKYI